MNNLSNTDQIKDSSQKILQSNFEVLIMNCTYKTNRYRMSLFVIIDQTAINIIFYVAFVFMSQKKLMNYIWILLQLKNLYVKLSLSFSVIMTTDCEKALTNAIRLKFSQTSHVFCIWHINNNVLINCKKAFNSEKAWETFFEEWKAVMYANSEAEYNTAWNFLSEKYNSSHSECIEYLWKTYILHYRRRFVKCFIDKIMHFGIIVTSREEDAHAMLKRNLITSIDDLKIVMNNLNLLLINQRHDYLIEFENAKIRYSLQCRIDLFQTFLIKFENVKIRYSLQCRIDLFQNIFAFVTSYALRKILNQYKRLIDESTILSACIKTFSTTLRLSCAHIIQERLESSDCLLIDDVHSHWRFEKSDASTAIDSLLHVQNSEVVRTRDRSIETENRTRRKKVFDNSTLRVSSQFEHVKSEMSTQMNEPLNDQIAQILTRTDSTSRRRGRSRESERARERDRAREQRERRQREKKQREEEQQEKRQRDDEDMKEAIQKTEQS